MLCILLGWMALIFLFSAQNSAESSSLSSGLLRKLLSLTPGWDALSAVAKARRVKAVHHAFRKLAHFSEYAVLGVIAAQTMRTCFPVVDIRWKCVRYFLIPAGFALLYAVCDEIHQIFVPGRSAQVTDVMIDPAGACTGILLAAAAVWFFGHRRQKKQQLNT